MSSESHQTSDHRGARRTDVRFAPPILAKAGAGLRSSCCSRSPAPPTAFISRPSPTPARCRSKKRRHLSVTVVDRDDRLLRAFTTTEGKWRLPLDPKDVDPHYLKMLFAFEDKRFYSHHGIDPKAVARAVLQMVSDPGSVRVCGSTVTGPITVTGSTGLVLIGGDAATGACAANFIVGPVSLTGNTAGVEFNGNMVIGPLTITGNTGVVPAPDTGTVHVAGNTVIGPMDVQAP